MYKKRMEKSMYETTCLAMIMQVLVLKTYFNYFRAFRFYNHNNIHNKNHCSKFEPEIVTVGKLQTHTHIRLFHLFLCLFAT